MSRVDQHLTTVTIDDRPLGVFDTIGGREVDSEETKYRPGGMGPQRSLGGQPTLGNVTLGRLYELARDYDLARWAQTRAGRGRVTVSEQPLDTDGNPYGRPSVYRGVLKTVTIPDKDSDSNDAAIWTIVVSTEGLVG